MKINNVNIQYEIPGFDISPQAFESDEGDDFEGAPYSHDPGILSAPPLGGWQQLLGLMHRSPTPTSIEPPTREATGQSSTRGTASYPVSGSKATPDSSHSATLSPRVRQMVAMLASRQEVLARIRIRAAEVSQ
jgi:hypothetical protein